MEQFTVKQTAGKALRFTGELLAEVDSTPDKASRWFSGMTGRWHHYKLWKTKGGKYVALRAFRTAWQSERDQVDVSVLQTVEEVIQFFGDGWLAQELYSEAGIDFAEDIP